MNAIELRIGDLISYFNNEVYKFRQFLKTEYTMNITMVMNIMIFIRYPTMEWISPCGLPLKDENNFILHQNISEFIEILLFQEICIWRLVKLLVFDSKWF